MYSKYLIVVKWTVIYVMVAKHGRSQRLIKESRMLSRTNALIKTDTKDQMAAKGDEQESG